MTNPRELLALPLYFFAAIFDFFAAGFYLACAGFSWVGDRIAGVARSTEKIGDESR